MDVKASHRQPQKVYPPLFITKKLGNFLFQLSPTWRLTLEMSVLIISIAFKLGPRVKDNLFQKKNREWECGGRRGYIMAVTELLLTEQRLCNQLATGDLMFSSSK